MKPQATRWLTPTWLDLALSTAALLGLALLADGIQYGEMADKLPKPPKRTNYDKFQDEDTGLDFDEWLGINKPTFETRGGTSSWYDRGPREYRMYRWSRGYSSYRDVEGEWAPTMKAAKASYKAALKKHHDELRVSRQQWEHDL